jgi:transposase
VAAALLKPFRPHSGAELLVSVAAGVHTSQLRDWVKKFADDPQYAFPGHGQMKPEQLEIARLKREVTKLKAERDILKKAAAYFAKEST